MQVKLEQIILFCADVPRLVKFYQEIFGLTVFGEQNDHWTVMNAGALNIAFHTIGPQYLTVPKESFQAGNNIKIVFDVDSDLVSFRQSLISKELEIGEIKHFPGTNYLVCDGHDPEGNVFQLKQNLG